MRWIETVRSTLAFLQGKILKLFHFTGERRTMPTCPVEPVINFSPTVGVATHTPSLRTCRFTAKYNLPFFVDKMGSEFMEWTTAVHEGIPGHHLQSASYREILKPRWVRENGKHCEMNRTGWNYCSIAFIWMVTRYCFNHGLSINREIEKFSFEAFIVD